MMKAKFCTECGKLRDGDNPLWCVECDKKRITRLSDAFAKIRAAFEIDREEEEGGDTNE